MRYILFIILPALAGLACADTGGDIADEINNVICLFVRLIWMVTGSLMALVIIFAGVKWLVSGEDPGARASAKNFIVGAFVGLIIIFTAVPVVDYLVGGILGYEFACGFFPEIDTGVQGNENTPKEEGNIKLTKLSTDEPLRGDKLVLGVPVLSRDVLGSGELFFCAEVSNTAEAPDNEDVITGEVEDAVSDEVDFRVDYDWTGNADLPYTLCSSNVGLILPQHSGKAVCKLSSPPEGFAINPEAYTLYFSLGEQPTRSYNLKEELKVDSENCPGDLPEETEEEPEGNSETKLVVQSVDGCSGLDAKAQVNRDGKWGAFAKEITFDQDLDKAVKLYGSWKGEWATSFTWDLLWDATSKNGQTLTLYAQDLPEEPETYQATITVKTSSDTCTETIDITVLSTGGEAAYAVDVARIGLTSDGNPMDFPKKRRVVRGSGQVMLYADWRGMPHADEFLWEINNKKIKGQRPPITWEQLPQTLGEHRISLTVTAEEKTYTDEVFIIISAEETTEEECVNKWGKWIPSGLNWPFGSYLEFGETSCCGDDPGEEVVCDPKDPSHCSCCQQGYDEITPQEGRCYTTSTKTCEELGGRCCPAGMVCRPGYEVEGSCRYSGAGCSKKTLCAKVAEAVKECDEKEPYSFCSSEDVCKEVGNIWNACIKNGYSASGADSTCPEEVCYNVYAASTICSSVVIASEGESGCVEQHVCRIIMEAFDMCPENGECCKECVSPQEAIECDESMDVCINDDGCGYSWLQSGEEKDFGGYKRYGQSGCCGDDPGEKAVCDREGIGKKCRCCMTDKNTVDGSGRCAIAGESEEKEENVKSSLRPDQKYLDALCGEDSGTFVESPENPFDNWAYLIDCSTLCGEDFSDGIEIISCHGPIAGGKYWCGCCCTESLDEEI
ncbi:MAG: TrbC/VirB2 family protein [Candidatus Altiarchaeota archaeon]|nr:TrbC/VirB2 family protein [Candidatus Altiarchaeota archaeon]